MAAESVNLLADAIRRHQAGDLGEAERLYRGLLETAPGHADANHNLGVLLVQQGNAQAALAHFRAAVQVPTSEVSHWFSLVECLVVLGRLGDALLAIAEAERAGLRGPEVARLQQRVAAGGRQGPAEEETRQFAALFVANDFIAAEAEAGRMLAWWPRHGFGWKALGAIRLAQRQFTEALPLLERAAELMPEDAETHNKLGGVLHALGRLPEAELRYRRALSINPGHCHANANLGDLCKDQGRLQEAIKYFQCALASEPTHIEASSNLAGALAMLGRYADAEAAYRRVLQLKPDLARVRSNCLFYVAYSGNRTVDDYLAEARQWEKHVLPPEVRDAARVRRFGNTRRDGRKLRIGYVSGDFLAHPVSRFVEPLFADHDRLRVEVHAFSTNAARDDVTTDIIRKVDHWHVLAGLSDEEAVKLIGEQGIDVLVDLSGHTGGNRLGVFARRAAPVQCHYLGYFASTGLTEMDYWIGDATLHPAGHEAQYSEALWRLPRVWVSYEAPTQAPEPRWQPAEAGTVRLGSFNHLGKITERTIALWARVLERIPQARLVLKTRELADIANREGIQAAFARHGVQADRLELVSYTSNWAEHMELYNGLDVALDPVGGIGGCTTTCDALWMGVPVVTFAGGRYAERMTTSILASLGHEAWAASSEEDYVERVAGVAADVQGRKALRGSLRETMRASPLCDARGLASALEDAFEAMFDRSQARGAKETA